MGKLEDYSQNSKPFSSTVKEALSVIYTVLYSIALSTLQSIFFFIPHHYKDIQSDVVLITGGGKGIGRLIAFELAKHKPKQMILWGRNADPLEATARAIRMLNVPCVYSVCDISNRQQVYDKAKEVCSLYGGVSILINNAAVVYGNTVLNSNPADIEYTVSTNIMGSFWLLKAFLPTMVASNRGHIVTVNSMLGLMGLAGTADYCASKHALTSFHECLASELRSLCCDGVKVTRVHPYMINTDLFAGAQVRFPALFGMLDRDYVAWRTVDAVLTEQQVILMPRIMYFFMFIRSDTGQITAV